MPGRACRCTAGASMLVARVRLPGAGRRGPAPPSGVELRLRALEALAGVEVLGHPAGGVPHAAVDEPVPVGAGALELGVVAHPPDPEAVAARVVAGHRPAGPRPAALR